MRISTNMIYDMGSSKISDLQAAMLKTQQQISTNRRVLTPADDPIASASAIGINQAISMNEQFTTNRQNAKGALAQEESVLQSMTMLLQSVKDAVVGAGNASMNDEQRRMYLAQLNTNYDELLGLANTRNANGEYIFSGYSTSTQPFSKTDGGATYAGDQGQRMLQVSTDRQMSTSDSGNKVFESTLTGNGHFTTSAAATNAGGGVISLGSVVDRTQLNGSTYTLTFAIDPVTEETTYTVTEVPAPPVPATPQPFVSGEPIVINGMQISIEGKPADGDEFTIEPSKAQSIFATVANLIAAFDEPMSGEVGQARLTNALNAANNHLDRTLDTVSSIRGSIGSRLNEIENLDNVGSDLAIQYADTLKTLVEIDPVEAYSQFTQQQYTLEAAQQSFIKITGLSLFNLLR